MHNAHGIMRKYPTLFSLTWRVTQQSLSLSPRSLFNFVMDFKLHDKHMTDVNRNHDVSEIIIMLCMIMNHIRITCIQSM